MNRNRHEGRRSINQSHAPAPLRAMRAAGIGAALVMASHHFDAAAHGQCQYAVVEPIIQAGSCGVGGPPATTPTGLNSHGHVVGHYAHCSISGHAFGFIWKPGTGMVTLPTPDGVTEVRPSDINDDGIIVGVQAITGMGYRGFVWDPATQEYTYLEPLHDGVVAHTVSSISAVNNAGVAVGSRVISEPGEPVVSNAVVWHPFGIDGEGPPVVIDLGVMDGPSSAAMDGNSGTVAAGWSGTAMGANNARAWIWTDGGAIELGVLPGTIQSQARAMNDSLEAIGSCKTPEGPFVSFHWSNGAMALFPPPDGYSNAGPSDITNFGQIVGGMFPAGGGVHDAYVWQHGEFHNLNEITVGRPPGLHLRGAGSVNGHGQIRVSGLMNGPSGKSVGVLVTPLGSAPADFNFDCKVDVHDLLFLLSEWGQPGSKADLNGNGTVGVADLLILLANWSP